MGETHTPDRGRARHGKCGDARAVNFLIYFNPHWHQPRPSQVPRTIPDALTTGCAWPEVKEDEPGRCPKPKVPGSSLPSPVPVRPVP